MQEPQPNFQFEWIKTSDGSPSLRLWKPQQAPECMHHSAGALSESLYIYGEAFEKTLRERPPEANIQVLSLGLGLGYNEMITTALALKGKMDLNNLFIDSFESEDFLTESFKAWVSSAHLPKEWEKNYDLALDLLAKRLGLDPEQIRSTLLSLLENDHLHLKGALTKDTPLEQTYHCLFFDAFSSGATPELWKEAFLLQFLEKAAAEKSVLSTYAATGNLKRALKKLGFQVEMRKGFSGKRHSTLATRSL